MKKKLLIGILIIVFIGVSVSLYFFLNYSPKSMSEAEKEAAIAKILGRKANLTDDTRVGNTEYKGKYVVFEYPAAADIKKQLLNGQELTYDGLERLIFKVESSKLTLYMEVIEAPANIVSLEDYPSVKLREIQSNIYTKDEVLVGSIKGLSYEKQSTSSFEKTMFFMLNGKIYSFSIQSPDAKEVEKLFNLIVSSVKFYNP